MKIAQRETHVISKSAVHGGPGAAKRSGLLNEKNDRRQGEPGIDGRGLRLGAAHFPKLR